MDSFSALLSRSCFAEQCGFVDEVDNSFLWILQVAWNHTLPDRWKAFPDKSYGEYYFVNMDDSASVWIHPYAPYVGTILRIARLYSKGAFSVDVSTILVILRAKLEEELSSWFGPFESDVTEEPGSYYVNNVTNVSSWEDPRNDAQLIHELQATLLIELERLFPLKSLDPSVVFPEASKGYLSGTSTTQLPSLLALPSIPSTIEDDVLNASVPDDKINRVSTQEEVEQYEADQIDQGTPKFGQSRTVPLFGIVEEQAGSSTLLLPLAPPPSLESSDSGVSIDRPQTAPLASSLVQTIRLSSFSDRLSQETDLMKVKNQTRHLLSTTYAEAHDRFDSVLKLEKEVKKAELLRKQQQRQISMKKKSVPGNLFTLVSEGVLKKKNKNKKAEDLLSQKIEFLDLS